MGLRTHGSRYSIPGLSIAVRTRRFNLQGPSIGCYPSVMGSWLVSGMLSQQLHGVTCILQARPFYPGPFYRPPGGLRYVWPLPVWDPDPPVWRPRSRHTYLIAITSPTLWLHSTRERYKVKHALGTRPNLGQGLIPGMLKAKDAIPAPTL